MNPNPFQGAHVLARQQQGLGTVTPGTSYTKLRCVVREARTEIFKTGPNAGKPYLVVTLVDRTGELEAKSWDGAQLLGQLHGGAVVELAHLAVEEYRGKTSGKFDPKDVRTLAPGDYEPREFVKTLPDELIEQNWRILQERLDELENPDLLKLRAAVFDRPDVAQAYKTHPSGIYHHHNYLGGNVQHVLGLVRIVDAVCAGYPEVDRETAVMGAVLHDLGKLREYSVDTMIRVTDAGRLRGHLVMGAEWLGDMVGQLRHDGYDFPQHLEDHLVHIILSHHRKGQWGSPKPPATPEAMLVHLADYTDSQTKGYLQFQEENQENAEGWARRWDSDAAENVWIRTRRDWD